MVLQIASGSLICILLLIEVKDTVYAITINSGCNGSP